MARNYTYIILALAAGLALQLYFTGWQTKRFYKRLKEIRKDGLTSVGLQGGAWSGRTYAVLVVDEDKKILHAEKLSGMTIFSNLKPVPALVGLRADEILDETREFPLRKKLMKAFRNAAKEFFKEEGAELSTIEDHKVKSVLFKEGTDKKEEKNQLTKGGGSAKTDT